MPAVALAPCLICPLATMLGGALSGDCLQHHLPCGGEGGGFVCARGWPHAAPPPRSLQFSLLPFQDPSLPRSSSLLSSSIPPRPSHVLFSPPVFFLLEIVATEPGLGCYSKGTRVTLHCGPGSKPLANRADIRENKL